MTSEDNGDLESFVASQYELVRRILESLTDLDLDACEKVNTLWANAVKVERNSDHRRRIEMFSWKGIAQTTRVIYLFANWTKFFGGMFFKIYVRFVQTPLPLLNTIFPSIDGFNVKSVACFPSSRQQEHCLKRSHCDNHKFSTFGLWFTHSFLNSVSALRNRKHFSHG